MTTTHKPRLRRDYSLTMRRTVWFCRGSGVLVCAATRAAMDAATTAVQIARSAQGTQHASTGTGSLR